MSASSIAFSMLLDAVAGENRVLRLGAPHPVVLTGKLIESLETRLNRGTHRRAKGALMLVSLLLPGFAISVPIMHWQHGWVLEILIGSILIAQRSLVDHVQAVADGLLVSLDEGRKQVAMIVGRDPESLDAAGVSRAAIESAAENFSDGVAAPVFWFAVAGLPGIVIYKIVNTADSMIGHRNERYLEFGWASARFDDLLNLVPARLTGFLFAAVSVNWSAVAIMFRDAPKHRSPNAGWPESAMAATLGVALAGPRKYGDLVVDDPYMNADGRREANAGDISRVIRLLWLAWGAILILAAVAAAIDWSL